MGIFDKITSLFKNGNIQSQDNQKPKIIIESNRRSTLIKNNESNINLDISYDQQLTYKKCNTFPEDYVVIDFETTGLSHYNDKIIQMSALKIKSNKEVERFNTFVNPLIEIPKNITRITGITNKHVIDAPVIDKALPKLVNFIGSDVIIAHNAPFDMKFFLYNTYRLGFDKASNQVICTLQLSRKYISGLKNYKLETLKNHFNLDVSSHNALDDCITCHHVYEACRKKHLSTIKEPNEFELECFESVKQILINNEKDIKLLKYRLSGSFFDIQVFYPFVRFKLRGKKRYLLTEHDEQYIKKLWSYANCEPAVKSENGNTRILMDTPNNLIYLETLIIDSYEMAVKSLEFYKQNVSSASRNIEEYLEV